MCVIFDYKKNKTTLNTFPWYSTKMVLVNFSDMFSDSVANSRKMNKSGQNNTLTFEASTDPKVQGSVFKTGKKNLNKVMFRQP